MKVIGVIPARYKSTRFEGKVIYPIKNIPMVVRVYNRAKKAKLLNDIVVATDDERVIECCKYYEVKCLLTPECSSGSDRVYEISKILKGDIYINIQGDEPLISSDLIDEIIKPFFKIKKIDVTSAVKKIEDKKDLENPNIVKVVFDKNNFALYFSRSPIPFNRDNLDIEYYKHIGIYGYRKKALTDFYDYQKGILEQSENLEQLRFLENNRKIYLIKTKYESIGVDIIDDIKKVEIILEKDGGGE